MSRDDQRDWDDSWAHSSIEDELATLTYERVQPALDFIRKHLPERSLVLEAGCGLGRFLFWLSEEGHRPVGIDWSGTSLARVKERWPLFTVAQADVRALPFCRNGFDVCLSFGVIEHFPEGPDACLREMHRVLAPGGVLVLCVPHSNFLARIAPPLKNVYRALRRIPEPQCVEPPGRYYGLSDLVEALDRGAFELLESMPYGHAYALHSFSGWFRRSDAYHDVTPLALRLGRVIARIAPWRGASTAFVAARKVVQSTGDEASNARRD